MPRVGFEPTISAGERPKTYALDRAATGTGFASQIITVNTKEFGCFATHYAFSAWTSVVLETWSAISDCVFIVDIPQNFRWRRASNMTLFSFTKLFKCQPNSYRQRSITSAEGGTLVSNIQGFLKNLYKAGESKSTIIWSTNRRQLFNLQVNLKHLFKTWKICNKSIYTRLNSMSGL